MARSPKRSWILPAPFPAFLAGVEQFLAAGKPPDALFVNVIWPCGDPGQIETPESRQA